MYGTLGCATDALQRPFDDQKPLWRYTLAPPDIVNSRST